MSGSPFIPRVYQEETVTPPPVSQPVKTSNFDSMGATILKVSRSIIVGLLFLLPVFFVPGLPASLGFDKVLLATAGGLSIVVLLGLLALRYTKVETVVPIALGVFWLVVLVAFISGALSGDIKDSLRGIVFEPQTAGFLAVMGLLMTVPLVLQRSKKMSMRALLAFGVGSALVLLYNLVRLVVGPETLTLGSFGTVTISPAGGFNDLAILAALTIVVSLITLLQLPLKRAHQYIIAAVSVLALTLMAVVNFFSLWIIVGFFALLLLIFIFSRDTLFAVAGEAKTPISPVLVFTTIAVCIVSIVFVVAGEYVGGRINAATEINYLEVRPSMTATLDVMKDVYKQDVLLGSGPNRFADMWRLHKDQTINDTIFWNTAFNAGFGFIPTLFVTLGILGVLTLVAFHVLYLRFGYRLLLRGNNSDSFWYYFGITTFAAAAFLWMMSYLYVSGPVILLLAALFTGLSFAAAQALVPDANKTIPLVSSRRRGFLIMTVVIVMIIASVSAVFTMAKQYVAQATFTQARAEATTPEEFQRLAIEAFQQYPEDTFLIASAQSRFIMLQNMLATENPTEDDQNRFVAEARQAVLELEEAIRLDDSNPAGHAALGDLFIVLSAAGFQDAADRATGKLEDAKWRDPLNPIYAMAEASLAIRQDDGAKAREKIGRALELKRNYSEALFLLSQLDVREGKLDDAVNTARQIITLEPDNPTRYYQLGVLQAAKKDLPASIEAYEAAIQLDNNFANARYMLALAYLDSNRVEDGLKQLRIVRETNQDNSELNSLISQIETNGYTPNQGTQNGLEGSVNEAGPNQDGDAVVSPTDPNTNLVSPVNTVPSTEGQQAPEEQPAQ